MVHFDRLDFSRHVRGGKVDNHASLDDTSLDSADGHRTNTTDLVYILQWETQRLVLRSNRGFDGVNGVKEGLALNNASLRLLRPALVPRHAASRRSGMSFSRKFVGNVLGRLLEHVVTVPAGNRDEGNGLGVVADLLDEVRSFFDDFIEPILRPLQRHIVSFDPALNF